MTFLDANILVYAHDRTDRRKHERARAVLEACWNDHSGVVSTQVLQEFYVTITRKLPKVLPKKEARTIIQELSSWPVYSLSAEDVVAATELEEEHTISFWDALIVVAAQKCGAVSLVSEDLQDGRRMGPVKIVNPFKE
jgi:predicted nucleic acid-binding protein